MLYTGHGRAGLKPAFVGMGGLDDQGAGLKPAPTCAWLFLLFEEVGAIGSLGFAAVVQRELGAAPQGRAAELHTYW